MTLQLYMAGPEVFLPPDVRSHIFDRKREICRSYDFEGVSPLDGSPLTGTGRELGLMISQHNEALMRSCAVIVANMTPFRGPSMDVGTAFELGFMRALGKLTLGYTNTSSRFLERTQSAMKLERVGDAMRDPLGLSVEDFGLGDNVMIDGAVIASGFEIERRDVSDADLYLDLDGFEACVAQAREHIGATP